MAYLDRQPYFRDMDRFLVRETGIHFIDVFRYLFGDVGSVWADLRQLNPDIKGEDAGLFVLDFTNRTRAIFDGNRLCDHAATNHRLTMGELQIEGARATLELTGDGQIFIRDKGRFNRQSVEFEWANTGCSGDSVYTTQKHILDFLEHSTPLETEASAYLTNLEIQELIYRSSKDGIRLTTA